MNQVLVDASTGWDYPAAISAILRADPDVLLAADVPDRETAALCVEAALRRCRTIATLGATDASGAVARVLELGINASSLSDALLGVLAQRLARRLCAVCRVSRRLSAVESQALAEEYCDGTPLRASDVHVEWTTRFGDLLLYSAPGCEGCGHTGYHGRIALTELLPVSVSVRRLIRQRRPLDELTAAAMQDGMRTLRQDGIEKALAGFCDLIDVRAATA